jgi:hypothetical protein
VLRWNELVDGAAYQLQEAPSLTDNPWDLSTVTPVLAVDQTGVPENYIRKEAVIPVDSQRKFLRVNGSED